MAEKSNNDAKTPWMSIASLTWTVFIACVGGAVSTTVTIYTMRDAIIQRTDERLAAQKTESREYGKEALSHYLSKEEFLEYRREDQERRDQQYYGVLGAIRGLNVDVKAPRR